MSIALVGVIEEAGQSLGQHLMVVVVRDEAVPGATDTFAAEQGAGEEAAKDLNNGIIREAASAFLLLGLSSILSVESLLSSEIT